MLTLHSATVTFEGARHPALDRVSLQIEDGSWTAIVGANGSGKSTLLGALAGLVSLRSGTLERSGTARVALLQQDADNQLVATSVRHELALSVPVDVAADERAARIEAAIDRFDLAHPLDRNPHRLSGGEKQRLACATAWLEAPDVLLLDEPLAFLDADARARVIDFVREAHARGVTVVWATPDDDAGFAREVVTLDAGRVVNRAPKAAPAVVERPARAALARGEAVLTIQRASFGYDGRTVLESTDLEVAKGECVGVVGRNSSGKSTLLALAGGALTPASGRVVRSPATGSVLYLPQTPERMFFAETVREEIAFGVKHLPARRGQASKPVDAIIGESLRAVGFDPAEMIARSPFELSFGEMRRVAFAIAHAIAPDLLLLDEPASCLDRAGRDVLAALVASRLEAGAAVVVASHDRTHLDGLCDRVLVLEDGRLS
ncbi:MAG TPA: ATP-binding cassette domain-containing protein [Candidatus Krumholzibacteria bacterium]|nr:ATP-binding cassette domain-containing protein [Candidatus Krumholzibacteria bacterium]